jgi:hypothetical protein
VEIFDEHLVCGTDAEDCAVAGYFIECGERLGQ